jgi:hypothetical protein
MHLMKRQATVAKIYKINHDWWKLMRLMIKKTIFTIIFLGLVTANAAPNEYQSCLIEAYSETLAGVNEDGNIQAKDGTVFVFDQKLDSYPHEYLLENSDLKSQFSQKYSVARLVSPPNFDWDPGRLRSEAFFTKVYGSSEKIVTANLEKVWWKPCSCYVLFTKTEGAAAALKRVGEEISSLPFASQYVGKPNGSMNWRKISGSSRLSMHAFGVAIDFSMPAGLQAYWKWSGCIPNKVCAYPISVLKDNNLAKIVEVFERHGFIWGGKWYHFDTIHFEYRPELLNPKCGLG